MLAIPTKHPLEDIPAPFPSGRRWYAFYTHIRAERRAGASIGVLGYPTFVPMEKRIRRVPGRKARPYEAALFPRYGFVQFDINRAEWGSIVEAKGVIDLVRVNAIPRSIPDTVIDGLRLADGMGIFDRTQPPKVGTNVEVSKGALTGFLGKIDKARSEDRVYVLFDFLGGKRLVSVRLDHLRET